MNDNRQGSGQFVGRPDTRLFEGGSSFQTLTNLGHSSYQSLQLRADQRGPTRLGLQFGANYAWSHSVDNVSTLGNDDRGTGTSEYLLNPFDPDSGQGKLGLRRAPSPGRDTSSGSRRRCARAPCWAAGNSAASSLFRRASRSA